jgi:hypothetical protein
MVRLKVNAPALEGHKFYRAGGPDKMKHAWPRGDAYVLVDVVDEDEDPAPDPSHEVLRIGRKTYGELLDESKRGRLNITAGDDPLGLAETKGRLAQIEVRLAELEGDIAFITSKVPADIMKGILSDLEKTKAEKTKPKAKEKPKA